MKKAYLGVDVGSISTKGVVIDAEKNVIASKYLWTEGSPISAIRKLVEQLKTQLDKQTSIVGVATTGSARKLAAAMLGANVIKNEITAHAIGTLSIFPDVKTILEIGGQDSKIIIIDKGIVSDYAMNTLCAAGTGAFLTSQAKRLGVEIEKFGELAMTSQSPAKLAARCTVFAESDLVHKAQIGYKKEDIVAGLCNAVAANYLNNLAKGKRICAPIVFQGGVSKNMGVVRAFEKMLGQKVLVDERGHFMGAIGAAVLGMDAEEICFDFEDVFQPFETKGSECNNCPNNCELINVFRNNKLIDVWGKRCVI